MNVLRRILAFSQDLSLISPSMGRHPKSFESFTIIGQHARPCGKTPFCFSCMSYSFDEIFCFLAALQHDKTLAFAVTFSISVEEDRKIMAVVSDAI